jgi:hypothetical protein
MELPIMKSLALVFLAASVAVAVLLAAWRGALSRVGLLSIFSAGVLAACGSGDDGDGSGTIAPPVTSGNGAAVCDGSTSFAVGRADGELVDGTRGRTVPYRLYYPQGASCSAAVILVSHGGVDAPNGENLLRHLGTEYASHGFLAVHIGHRGSANAQRHLIDRPADVSLVIDALTSGALTMPAGFAGRPDLSKIGHTGHSYGAYTAHAVGGAVFTQGSFTDRRVRAIAPISPQGPGQFGGFDNGATDNSWRNVPLPAYNLVGELEKDRDTTGTITMPNWRLYPFERYGDAADRFLSIVPGQTHGQMAEDGSDAVKAFIATNTRTFFDVYLRGQRAAACSIGTTLMLAGTQNARRAAATGSSIASCAPDVGATLEASAFEPSRPDTETVALTTHRGRLFAARGQWMAPVPNGAAVLVKDSADAAWREFHRFANLRVLALRSFNIPAVANGGTAVDLLIATTGGSGANAPARLAWLRNDAADFEQALLLPNADADPRSMTLRVEGGVAALYVGTRPGGIYRYTWDAAAQRLVAPTAAELSLGPADERVMEMAVCAGGVYAVNGGDLLRRADTNPPRWQRWLVGRDTSGSGNSGWRGLTCTTHDSQPALLTAFEGPGLIMRVQPLPAPNVVDAPTPTTVEEADARQVIRAGMAQRLSRNLASDAVAYSIVAYNDMVTVPGATEPTLLLGVEWSWRDACAAGRSCSQGRFDDCACFIARRGNSGTPAYALHCLSGADMTPRGTTTRPIRYRDAFVATRAIRSSPFGDDSIYFGGYDANGQVSEGTAWIARGSLAELRRVVSAGR